MLDSRTNGPNAAPGSIENAVRPASETMSTVGGALVLAALPSEPCSRYCESSLMRVVFGFELAWSSSTPSVRRQIAAWVPAIAYASLK
jgi:hypothetical protein